MLPSVTTLPLSTHPFPYTFSPPPYLIHDLSSLFCLKCTLHSVHPSIYLQFLFAYNGPTNQNNQLWLGRSKLHSKLWFVISIISCFVVEYKYEIWNEIQNQPIRAPLYSSGGLTSKVMSKSPFKRGNKQTNIQTREMYT